MSVKNELDQFFEKFIKKYQETPEGLPRRPRRKDIDQEIYVGDPNSSGWCGWKPIPHYENEAFLSLLDDYKIEKNPDIVEFFSSYYFLGFDVEFKNYLIAISSVEPRDGYKRLIRTISAFTDSNGKITHIKIGVEQKKDLSVVVEVKTGIVKLVNDETGKMRKIAPSLEEFIRGWEPHI